MTRYTITTSNGYEYEMLTDRVDDSSEKPVTSTNVPGEGPEQNILTQFEGENNTFRFNVLLADEGTDKSNGTAPQGTVYSDTDGDTNDDIFTAAEQRHYLKNYVKPPSLNVDATLSGGNLLEDYDGVITNIDVQEGTPSNSTWRAVIEFTVGSLA